MKDLYDVMRVQPNASAEQIQVTYRVLAKELHPDRNPRRDAAERFNELQTAFEVLVDPERRRAYDKRRRRPTTPAVRCRAAAPVQEAWTEVRVTAWPGRGGPTIEIILS